MNCLFWEQILNNWPYFINLWCYHRLITICVCDWSRLDLKWGLYFNPTRSHLQFFPSIICHCSLNLDIMCPVSIMNMFNSHKPNEKFPTYRRHVKSLCTSCGRWISHDSSRVVPEYLDSLRVVTDFLGTMWTKIKGWPPVQIARKLYRPGKRDATFWDSQNVAFSVAYDTKNVTFLLLVSVPSKVGKSTWHLVVWHCPWTVMDHASTFCCGALKRDVCCVIGVCNISQGNAVKRFPWKCCNLLSDTIRQAPMLSVLNWTLGACASFEFKLLAWECLAAMAASVNDHRQFDVEALITPAAVVPRCYSTVQNVCS